MNNGIYHCSEWDNRQEVFCVLPYVCSADIAGPNVVILLLYCEKKKKTQSLEYEAGDDDGDASHTLRPCFLLCYSPDLPRSIPIYPALTAFATISWFSSLHFLMRCFLSRHYVQWLWEPTGLLGILQFHHHLSRPAHSHETSSRLDAVSHTWRVCWCLLCHLILKPHMARLDMFSLLNINMHRLWCEIAGSSLKHIWC